MFSSERLDELERRIRLKGESRLMMLKSDDELIMERLIRRERIRSSRKAGMDALFKKTYKAMMPIMVLVSFGNLWLYSRYIRPARRD